MDTSSDREFSVASVDLGTVSSRLLLAQVRGGAIVRSVKHTVITDLGEGVDATGSLSAAAIARVLDACTMFCEEIRAAAPDAVCTTLTSAARDAHNGADLLDGLRELGLRPQVIPGEVEARLTFYGVAHDFCGKTIVVADSGGGSTELAQGRYLPGCPLELSAVRSLDIGCRRITERFFDTLPPMRRDIERAAAWAREQFSAYWQAAPSLPEQLVAVGGTVTTLVALLERMDPYDSSRVHLHELTLEDVQTCIDTLSGLDAAGAAHLPGVQEKRAPVLLGGAVIIRELMTAGGYPALTVSENSLLAGMAATMFEALCGKDTVIGWKPEFSC